MNYFLAKILWGMIEPLADRMSSVEDFLHDIDPSLQYHIVPISAISDPFGPTKEDPSLEVSGIIIDCLFFSALPLTIISCTLTECAMRLTV
jgi:phosphopantetheine adenylyltransferase